MQSYLRNLNSCRNLRNPIVVDRAGKKEAFGQSLPKFRDAGTKEVE